MSRNEEIIERCKTWLFEHTDGTADYVGALRRCGFTFDEVKKELIEESGYNADEAEVFIADQKRKEG